ncbi:antitoxin MazE family protein [Rhodopseudomonas sp. HC1]|uniref:antitoxin MazE family protein n=1 Tax=Rhodopseudomonas infernalis TaxID=2897386 RepID=UPI001EE8AF10|nr:antitoxin MazE family protein [Rhodopseudomonas infernalis]MCG6205475.1 antitoxin MazE family protein [Rhodopseudomonas infernalis]
MDRKVDKSAKTKRPPAVPGGPANGRSASAERVRRHREKMKATGLKPVTIWVPEDYKSPEFRAEIRRQCLVLKNDPHERQILAEIEDWYDAEGWK